MTLRQLKYIIKIVESGSITEAAVKSFQKDNDISQTGVAAKLTLEKINSLLNITKIDASRVYRSGDEDAGVKALPELAQMPA